MEENNRNGQTRNNGVIYVIIFMYYVPTCGSRLARSLSFRLRRESARREGVCGEPSAATSVVVVILFLSEPAMV